MCIHDENYARLRVMYEQLEARLAEAEQRLRAHGKTVSMLESDRCVCGLAWPCPDSVDGLREMLAASEAREKALREALASIEARLAALENPCRCGDLDTRALADGEMCGRCSARRRAADAEAREKALREENERFRRLILHGTVGDWEREAAALARKGE